MDGQQGVHALVLTPVTSGGRSIKVCGKHERRHIYMCILLFPWGTNPIAMVANTLLGTGIISFLVAVVSHHQAEL
jgi:hypothetical protein